MTSRREVDCDDPDGNEERLKTQNTDEDIFASISNEIDSAIQVFIGQYHSLQQQRVTILDHEFEKSRMEAARNSFTSGMFRLKFSLSQNHQSSVLFKIPHLGPAFPYVQGAQFYEKERYMYQEILPRIHALWPEDQKPPFPHFYVATDSCILVLENLEESGFRTTNKDSLLDVAGAKAVLRSLARFHAISTRLLEEEDLRKGLDDVTVINTCDSAMTAGFYASVSVAFQKHIFPLIGEGARKMFEDFFANYRSVVKFGNWPNANGFKVILHGDLHLRNILFRGDECRLVDFQVSRRGSPVIDLIFFLASSVKFEVVENHRDAFLEFYLQEFNRMVDSSERRYGLDMLNADLVEYRSFFVCILSLTAVTWIDKWKLDDKEAGETHLDRVLMSEKYRSTLRSWIRFFKFE